MLFDLFDKQKNVQVIYSDDFFDYNYMWLSVNW